MLQAGYVQADYWPEDYWQSGYFPVSGTNSWHKVALEDNDASFNNVTVTSSVRASTSAYHRYYHIPLYGTSPGASGPTFAAPDGNTTGGWQLDTSTEYIYGEFGIHADWDGTSDPILEIHFSINVDNTGGAVDDVAAGDVVFYYKGIGDTVTKTQTINGSITVGQAAQYTQFKIEIPLDWDLAGSILEVGDQVGCRFNLNTGTSDIDDVIVEAVSAHYGTTHVGIESGDV